MGSIRRFEQRAVCRNAADEGSARPSRLEPTVQALTTQLTQAGACDANLIGVDGIRSEHLSCLSDSAKCRRLIGNLLLARCSSSDWGQGTWGYPFPWQAKAFYVPVGTPNVIATAYAVRGLVDCKHC